MDELKGKLLKELANDLRVSFDSVKEMWEKNDLLLFLSTQEMNHFLKNREDKEKSLDIYQLTGFAWGVDLKLIGRGMH